MVKPQDIVVLLALIGVPRSSWDYQGLGKRLGVSVSAVHRSIKRLTTADLYSEEQEAVRSGNALELLVHAAKYIAPLHEGPVAIGVPTGASASPLRDLLESPHTDAVDAHWVWPHPEGELRGMSIAPLVPTATAAALASPELHRRLSVIDALRGGRARERRLAEAWLRDELGLS